MPIFTVTVPVTIEVDCRSKTEARREIERFSSIWQMNASLKGQDGEWRKVSIKTKLGAVPEFA